MRKLRCVAMSLIALGLTSVVASSAALAKYPRTYAIPEPLAAEQGAPAPIQFASAADEPVLAPAPDGMSDPTGVIPSENVTSGVFDSCCGSCYGCCPSRCCCGPKWTFRGGTIFLYRGNPSSLNLAASTVDGVTRPVLNANQLGLGTGWGYEVDAIRHGIFDCCTDAEIRYFGIYGFNASSGPVTANNVDALYATPFGIGGPTTVRATYTSQLQNVEMNLRRQTASWLQLLAGFRWIELDDTLSQNLAFTRVTTTGSINTINRLFGGQVGADAAIWQRNRLSLDAIGKVGVFGNAATSSFLVSNMIVGGRSVSALLPTGTRGQTAFVSEIGITGKYCITNNIALRTTYELLWIDGVATASDQVPNQLPRGLGASAVSINTVFYTGAFIGLEFKQ